MKLAYMAQMTGEVSLRGLVMPIGGLLERGSIRKFSIDNISWLS